MRQRTENVDALFDKAALINERFQDLVWDVVGGVQRTHAQNGHNPGQGVAFRNGHSIGGAQRIPGPVKTPERAIQKVPFFLLQCPQAWR